jgi:beta-lactamase class A
MAARLNGSVGLAVAPFGAGPIRTFGTVQTAHAWSTSKVPVLATLLSTDERLGRTLTRADRQNATLALTESDNAAIESLFSSLEQLHGGLTPASDAVADMFRRAGDPNAVVNTVPNTQGFTTYGQSEWSLRDETTFYRALVRGCLLSSSDTRYVLGLMREVIPSQRWGAGSAGYPSSVQVAFKGGWGPVGGDYQVRQTAIIGSGNRGYTLAMIALPANGSFSDGTNMLSALATWARKHVELRAGRPPGACPATS